MYWGICSAVVVEDVQEGGAARGFYRALSQHDLSYNPPMSALGVSLFREALANNTKL